MDAWGDSNTSSSPQRSKKNYLKISIVIPTYNRLRLLKEALASIWVQTYGLYEVTVVDDGSSDGTLAYLEFLGDRINLVRQQRAGPAAARNAGFQRSSGDYIAFLDSDDIWLPWTLETFQHVAARYQPSLISGAVLEFSEHVPRVDQGELSIDLFQDFLETAKRPGFASSCNMLVKRKVIQSLGGFDESLTVAEDHDLFFRIGVAKGYVRILSPVTTLYRRHAGNTASLRLNACVCSMAMLRKEVQKRYPGGHERRKERWQLLGRTLRPIALAAAKAGMQSKAWYIYGQSFGLNLRTGRLRFLLGFPFWSLAHIFLARRAEHSLLDPRVANDPEHQRLRHPISKTERLADKRSSML